MFGVLGAADPQDSRTPWREATRRAERLAQQKAEAAPLLQAARRSE